MIKQLCQSLLLCCASTVLCAQTSDQWCKGIDVQLESTQFPIRVKELTFASAGEMSFALAKVLNAQPKKIAYYLVLVELFDKDGKHLLTFPFYNVSRKTGETSFPIAFTRWLYGHQSSDATLGPLSEGTVDADSSTVALTCPATARIAFVQLSYADGTSFSYVPSSLTLDPVLAWAPISDPALFQRPPTFVLAKLAVDANGKAKLISVDDNFHELFASLQKQTEAWLLSPPLVEGKPQPAELTLLLYLEDVRWPDAVVALLPPEFADRMLQLRTNGIPTVIVVHAYRHSRSSKMWIVKAGPTYVERLDERQR